MARPVKPRDVQGLARDVQQLIRLRMSVMIDDSIDPTQKTELGAAIESLVAALQELSRKRAA
jgi:hypothetical protein